MKLNFNVFLLFKNLFWNTKIKSFFYFILIQFLTANKEGIAPKFGVVFLLVESETVRPLLAEEEEDEVKALIGLANAHPQLLFLPPPP